MKNLLYIFAALLLNHLSFSKIWNGEKEEKLDNFIESLMRCRDNVGMFVALVKDGEVAFTGGYGYRDLEQRLPVTPSTRFCIASISKAFTTTLASEKIHNTPGVSWSTPISEILGENFELQDDFRTDEATLVDLFSHKMGMNSYWGVSTAGMNISLETLAMERFRHFPVRNNFRTSYLYSNYLYQLGARVTEVLAGEEWEDQVYRTLLDPIGMSQTRAAGDMHSAEWHNTAYSYTIINDEFTQNPEEDQLPFIAELAPAGGLFSTAQDMAKYILFHLNEGKAEDGTQVVPESVLRDIYQPRNTVGRESPRVQRPAFPVDDMRLTYGLAWHNGMYRGTEKNYHTGSYSSYNCYLSLLPGMEAGAIACVNSPGDIRGSRAAYLATAFGLDLVLDEEPWLNETTACTFPNPWSLHDPLEEQTDAPHYVITPKDTSREKRRDTDFIGTYRHLAFGDFKVYKKEGSGELAYEFGILLSGDLKDSGSPTDFYMTLNHPLTYRHAFFPQYPYGFPVYFSSSLDNGEIDTVQVTYFEFNLPPVFVKVDD